MNLKLAFLFFLCAFHFELKASTPETILNFYIIDMPPYGEMKEGKLKGHYVELAQLLEKSLKKNFDKTLVPYARAANVVIQGNSNLAIMRETKLLQENSTKIAPLLPINSYVLISPSKKNIKKLSDIKNMSMGRLRGGCLDLDPVKLNLQFVDLNTYETGLHLLENNRIDGVCGTKIGFGHVFKTNKIALNNFGPLIFVGQSTVYLHTSPNMSLERKKELQEAVMHIKNDPEFKRISKIFEEDLFY